MATKRKPSKKRALATKQKTHSEMLQAIADAVRYDGESRFDKDALLKAAQETVDDVPVEFGYARRPIGWKDVLAACLFSALLGFIIGVHL